MPTSGENAVSAEEHSSAIPVLDSIGTHLKRTAELATPVVFSRFLMVAIFTADTIMVGQVDGAALAYLGLGLSIQSIFFLVSIGMLQGTMIISSQAYGAADYEDAGKAWRIGSYHAIALGLGFGWICLLGEEILLLLGFDAEMSANAGAVSIAFGLSMPSMLFYICSSYFLEAVQRPSVGMIVMIGANVLNILLNLIFVWGWGGFVEPMSALGAAIGTSIVRWGTGIAIGAYILTMPWRTGEDPFGLKINLAKWWAEARTLGGDYGKRLRGLGTSMAVMLGMEGLCTQIIVLIAASFGKEQLAAYQVATSLLFLIVMIAIGCMAATSVRVGNAVGRADQPNMRRAGFVGIGLTASVMIPAAILLALFPGEVASVYVKDVAITNLVAVAFGVVALVVVADGIAACTVGALRGTGDVWPVMYIATGSLWVIGLPSGLAYAYLMEMGPPGLIAGLGTAYFVSGCVLLERFTRVSRKLPKRV